MFPFTSSPLHLQLHTNLQPKYCVARISETYLRIRWSDEEKRADGRDWMCSREAPALPNKNVRSQRVKGQTALRGRGFRTPCCVINNFLDSMYSALSPFPKKAAACTSAGCSAKKIQIKPQLLTDNDPDTHRHTYTHNLRQTHHIHISHPCMAACHWQNTGTQPLSTSSLLR